MTETEVPFLSYSNLALTAPTIVSLH